MSDFTTPDHILTGRNVLNEAKKYLVTYGKKALIVTGKHVVESSMMSQLKQTLEDVGIAYEIFDNVTGEPTDVMIEDGIRRYRSSACDFCIGIGGGSPLDSAKAIAAMITNQGKIADYNGKEISNQIPPVVAIPTTAGTGSEATKFTVITDSKRNIKMLLKGESLLPTLAIVDAEFGLTAPKSVTAATGLDALTHAIEAYTSKKASALTDIYAISAVSRIMKYLPDAFRNGEDKEAREQMSLAALEAGICINNSSVTLVHGMSRPIGALFHVPHGMSNAMLLKECLTFAMEGAVEKFAALGNAIQQKGVDVPELSEEEKVGKSEAYNMAQRFLQAVEEICRICEIPGLEEYGIDKKEFFPKIDKMSKDAIDSGSPANTIRMVTESDCKEIYQRLFN